ncbi:phosphate signaling complex PhoU family protein, partial [Cobetia marina]
DESSKIARNAISLVENGQSPRGMVEVRHLSQHVRSMVRDSLTAFARFDTDLALKVLREDASVDLEYQSAMRSLMTFMMEDARQITPVLNVMWILRALERIGDHADNLAEYVIFLVKGVDVRHTDTHDLQPQDLDKP